MDIVNHAPNCRSQESKVQAIHSLNVAGLLSGVIVSPMGVLSTSAVC